MNDRSLDEYYVPFTIKEYTYWILQIHEDQRYLGRCCAWLVRPGGMQRFSHITDEEMAELRVLMREYETAIEKISRPDFMNYAWLANLIEQHGGHGHLHLIPRYEQPRSFAGIEFVDGRWGKNFSPYDAFKPPREIVFQLRDAIRSAIVAG